MFKDLDIILAEGEGYKVEFKESPDKNIVVEACAFLNASGGRIFIGINDNGQIVGTNINNEFLQSESVLRYDSMIRNEFLIKDNFNETAYKTFLRKSKISDVLPFESVLINLGCVARREDGELVYTNSGALFFRDNTEDVFFEYAKIVCALFKGTDKAIIIDAKEFNGNMVENIDNVMKFLRINLRLRYEINARESVARKEILELPEEALREAVINAVCHRNYFEQGANVMVEIFDDRVEVSSPGGIPKGLDLEEFGTKSVTRNPIIADLLRRVNYIEKMGTGIIKIKKAMEEANLTPPIFTSKSFFTVIFKRTPLYENITALNVGEMSGKCRENVGKMSEKKTAINNTQQQILELIKADNNITIEVLAKKIGITTRTVERGIEQLKIRNYLIRQGGAHGGYWEIIE